MSTPARRRRRGRSTAGALLAAMTLMIGHPVAPAAAGQTPELVAEPVKPSRAKDNESKHRKHKKRKKKHDSREHDSIPEMIRDVFGKHADEAMRVARCESHFRPDAVSHAGAVGVFQIQRVHDWRVKKVRGKDLHDPFTNVRVAYSLMKDEGWRPWVCARMLGVTSGTRRGSRATRSTYSTSGSYSEGSWTTSDGSRRPRTPRRPGMAP
jgi:hypothetical protein